jgi:hypothetical protein
MWPINLSTGDCVQVRINKVSTPPSRYPNPQHPTSSHNKKQVCVAAAAADPFALPRGHHHPEDPPFYLTLSPDTINDLPRRRSSPPTAAAATTSDSPPRDCREDDEKHPAVDEYWEGSDQQPPILLCARYGRVLIVASAPPLQAVKPNDRRRRLLPTHRLCQLQDDRHQADLWCSS